MDLKWMCGSGKIENRFEWKETVININVHKPTYTYHMHMFVYSGGYKAFDSPALVTVLVILKIVRCVFKKHMCKRDVNFAPY